MPIQFRRLEKRFGEKHVLRGVDLDIHDGECFFVYRFEKTGAQLGVHTNCRTNNPISKIRIP